jgi:DNA-binding MarR family transcriptional regulator
MNIICRDIRYDAAMPTAVPDDQLAAKWHAIMSSVQRVGCRLDRELGAAHGISSSEFEALQQLNAAGNGKMRMSELAEHAHLTQSALSRLVGRLEKDGLVTRSVCEDDRRSVWTQITGNGRDLYKQAKLTQRAILREETEAALRSS